MLFRARSFALSGLLAFTGCDSGGGCLVGCHVLLGLGRTTNGNSISINLDPSQPDKVAIEAVRMNVLYIGVDNPIKIAATGIPPAELQVEPIGDGGIQGENGEYIAVVTKPGEVKIRVTRSVNGAAKLVVDQKYRVKWCP
jgi:hypothetical protein